MRIREEIKIREIAGERVAVRQGEVDVDLTKIISFNSSAEWLWNQLTGKDFTEQEVINLLVESFGIDEAIAKQDAKKWIDQCINAEIIDA